MDGSAIAARESEPDSDPESNQGTDAAQSLSRREAKWLLKRCAKRGHLLAYLDDAELAARFRGTSESGPLLRCLRCGDFTSAPDPQQAPGPQQATDPQQATGQPQANGQPAHTKVIGSPAHTKVIRSPAHAKVIGSPAAPLTLGEVPLALRGGHGRKLALLRVLAIERGGRGLVLMLAAAGVAQLANSHVAAAEWLARIAKAAQPLGQQFGWDPAASPSLDRALDLLGRSSNTFTTVAWLLAAYGVLQVVEGVGLWGGWLWAEYLAAIATSIFVPVELYELTKHATVLKATALLVNLAAVGYLVFKGRLFGVRGGHPAYRAEVRDSTLPAEELRALRRPTNVLSSHELM